MALRFLLDENLPGRLWAAVMRHNARGINLVDAIQVGDPPALPRGSQDPDILIWAEAEDRILVSEDLSTLPIFLANHLQSGRHSPGIILIRHGTTLKEVVEFVVLAAHASEPWEWADRCQFIPV
jgi:predicted nuclease of predicted toxin-antitoxin system